MVPGILDDWTLDRVRSIVESGHREDETFDFKESLPAKQDEDGKWRLKDACASFANADGGFIVFGVKDSTTTDASVRVVGMAPSIDFAEHFGNFPNQCTPTVEFMIKNPPIVLADGNLLHVVQIPKSLKAPHSTKGSRNRSGLRFMKRSGQGDCEMSMEDVTRMFLGQYEKRLKLQLLRSEFGALAALASQSINARRDDHSLYFSLIGFDTSLLQALTAETISLTAHLPIIFTQVQIIRQNAILARGATDIILPIVNMDVTQKDKMLRNYNAQLDNACQAIQIACFTALEHLNRILEEQPS